MVTPADPGPVRLTKAQLDDLLEYSCSLPSGTTIGKRWKCDRNAYLPIPRGMERVVYSCLDHDWWMGEYVDIGSATEVGIVWRKIEVTS